MHRYHGGLARSQRPPARVSIKVSHPFRGETDDTETLAADSSPSQRPTFAEASAPETRRPAVTGSSGAIREPDRYVAAAPSWVSEGAR